jgi:hypothetical protein
VAQGESPEFKPQYCKKKNVACNSFLAHLPGHSDDSVFAVMTPPMSLTGWRAQDNLEYILLIKIPLLPISFHIFILWNLIKIKTKCNLEEKHILASSLELCMWEGKEGEIQAPQHPPCLDLCECEHLRSYSIWSRLHCFFVLLLNTHESCIRPYE